MMAVISIPSLAVRLTEAEQRKGAPLTQEEVESVNSRTLYVCVPDNIARGMEVFCGYADIDPHKCWEAWLNYRAASRVKRPEKH